VLYPKTISYTSFLDTIFTPGKGCAVLSRIGAVRWGKGLAPHPEDKKRPQRDTETLAPHVAIIRKKSYLK